VAAVREEGEDEDRRLRAWRRATDLPLIVIAIGTLPILLLELERDALTDSDRLFIDVVNVVVLVVFAVDCFVELVLTRDRWRYVRTEWMSLLVVVAQAAAIAPGLAGFGALRALRGARVVRFVVTLVRLLAIGGVAARHGRATLFRHAGPAALGVAGLTWISSAVAFTLAEDVGEGGRLTSFFEGLWWSTTTITTVGYGDVYPVTAAGRIVGGFTMVIGISTFAVVTAKVAELLFRSDGRADADADEDGGRASGG